MEMGLGKTGTVLSEFMEYRDAGYVDCLVVICLNQFQNQWVNEAINMGLSVVPLVWPFDAKVKVDRIKKADMVVINWESLIHSGGEWLRTNFFEKRKVYFAFDECQIIKNPQSRVTKWCMVNWKGAIFRRGLTGTPMGLSVMDLYPQLRLAHELDGINPYVFRNRYAKMGGYMGKSVVGINEEKKADLDEILDRCSFRALKQDWLDLPEKTYVPAIQVPMPPVLKRHYDPMLKEFCTTLENGDDVVAEMVISQMLKLQEISSGFIIDGAGKPVPLCDPATIPKYQVAFGLAESVLGQSKLLIFTYFKYTTRVMIEELTKKFGIAPAYLIGGMTPDETAAQKDAFNSDSGPPYMVAQLSVGNASHTLLGGPTRPCHSMLYFENWFSLLKRAQSEDRIHRIGQKYPCTYYDIASSPVEKTAIVSLQKKKDLVRSVIDHRTEFQKFDHGW